MANYSPLYWKGSFQVHMLQANCQDQITVIHQCCSSRTFTAEQVSIHRDEIRTTNASGAGLSLLECQSEPGLSMARLLFT